MVLSSNPLERAGMCLRQRSCPPLFLWLQKGLREQAVCFTCLRATPRAALDVYLPEEIGYGQQ